MWPRFSSCSTPLARWNRGPTRACLSRTPSNLGGFRAFLGLNQAGRNDYQSGLNFDLGPGPSPSINLLNAEGAGFEGVRNLVTNSTPFGAFHILTLLCETGDASVRAFLDG